MNKSQLTTLGTLTVVLGLLSYWIGLGADIDHFWHVTASAYTGLGSLLCGVFFVGGLIDYLK